MTLPSNNATSAPRPNLLPARFAPAAVLAALLYLGPLGLTPAVADEPTMPAPHHHRSGGFQNNYIEFAPHGIGDLLKWRLDAWRNDLPGPALAATPRVTPDLGFIAANARAGAAAMQPAITWIGHATVLAQLGGLNILTDPMFSERASPLAFAGPKRHAAPGLALAELPHIDLVLISHNHYDHLDEASVRVLAAQKGGPPLFIVPLGIKSWLVQRGIVDVVELDWWQSHPVATNDGGSPIDVVFTPAQHWSGRSLSDRMETLWGGYAVFAPDLHLFFAGDTAYSKDFSDIHERFASRPGGGNFDIALVPIGAYEPRWFMSTQHADPLEAVQIHLDLKAHQSVGIHWGTFQLTDEPLDQPPRDLAKARAAKGLADDAFFVLAVGETRKLARRPP